MEWQGWIPVHRGDVAPLLFLADEMNAIIQRGKWAEEQRLREETGNAPRGGNLESTVYAGWTSTGNVTGDALVAGQMFLTAFRTGSAADIADAAERFDAALRSVLL